MQRSVATAILISAGLGLLAIARADIIYLESGGQQRGKILEENRREVVIETSAGRVTIPRLEISRIVREEDTKDQFKRRWSELKASRDPDAWYELGRWAAEHELPKGSKACFEKAVALDAFHRPAREALGHRYHQGRWYSEEEYLHDVLGLVEFDGRWVTPEERERLEQGLVRGEDGVWRYPNGEAAEPVPAVARREPAPETAPAGFARARPEPSPAAPAPRAQPLAPPPASPAGDGEDTAWYRDNFRAGDFNGSGEVESRYYKIKTNIRPEYAERYGQMMDRYYVRFLKVFREYLPQGDLPKSSIWVYSSQQEFQAATGMGLGVGGFYNTGNKRVTAYHGLFGDNGTTRTVLAHEGTHQFEDIILQGSFGNCPIWILEGLAVFFESAYYDGEEVIIGLVPRDRLAALKRGLATGTLIPLSQLIRTPQPAFTGYHYAHAWGLIYMVLYYGDSKPVRKRCQQWFSELMMASRRGPVTADEVEERCGGHDKFLELEEKWKEWLRDLPYDYDPRKN